MISLLVALSLSAAPGVARDANGKILRHRAPIAAFMKANPCPYAPDTGSTTRCRNGKVDHKIPLCAGGPDEVSNLQWQDPKAAREKDALEVWICNRLGGK